MDRCQINGTRIHTGHVFVLDSLCWMIAMGASGVLSRVVGLCVLTFLIGVASISRAEKQNLVQNGGFEQTSEDSVPTAWATSGRREIEQALMVDKGHDGGRAAKLSCSRFVGGTPDSHVMICQVGVVPIRKGMWYRLRLWCRAADIAKRMVSVEVSNTRPWGSSGVGGRFSVSRQWKKVEILARATRDVPAETSRLQFWFASTGTLWLDDVVLEQVDIVERVHPLISNDSARNPIPNSSFECGTGGWGSYSPTITTWAGNLNQLVGLIDTTRAVHGECSLRIDLDMRHPLVFQWDYFVPIVQPIRCALAATQGWIAVQPGRTYQFSCYLRADKSNVPVRLMAVQHRAGRRQTMVKVGTQWKRFVLEVVAHSDALWVGVGPDLTGTSLESVSVWVDALQLDCGAGPLPFAPRAEVESMVQTGVTGNIFTDPDAGVSLEVRFANNAKHSNRAGGRLVVTDFWDNEVVSREVLCNLRPESHATISIDSLLQGRLGFYRLHWFPADSRAPLQSLRCALVHPYVQSDSPFGMNHAYPWDFMLQLCKAGGLVWMRDWSAKWDTVEPKPDRWDFSKVDPQINRVVANGLHPLVLLPYPSSAWCSGADMNVVRKYADGDSNRLQRAIVACAPKKPELFRNYVAKTVGRYRDRTRYFEIMNEPLYTSYAVPARFGYGIGDYLALLRDAHQVIRKADPDAKVIGGIGGWVDSKWVREFIAADGLRWCDVMDIHLYPITIDPELYGPELSAVRRVMRERGQEKPIWLTEFGCYADDDPSVTPSQIGDSAMSRAGWPSERAASEALVKSAAVFLSHGVEKIFFHAGTCGPINGRNGGGIFFEYGGVPRKMYGAVCSLANRLGPAPKPLPTLSRQGRVQVYPFQKQESVVAVVWAGADQGSIAVPLGGQLRAFDIMGNRLSGTTLVIGATPTYVATADVSTLEDWIRRELPKKQPLP